MQQIGSIHITGSKLIDIEAVFLNLMECIEGCKLLETNEIIITDYRLYLIDINLKKCYRAQLSS